MKTPVNITVGDAEFTLRLHATNQLALASLLTKPTEAGKEFEAEYLTSCLLFGARAIKQATAWRGIAERLGDNIPHCDGHHDQCDCDHCCAVAEALSELAKLKGQQQ